MRIKVSANSLVDTDIELVSLVKRGANRSPFKVMKSDDKPNLIKSVAKMFHLGDEKQEVNCYYVLKSVADRVMPVLAKAGVDVSNFEEADGVVIVKQAGYDESADVRLVKMNAGVGVAIRNIHKDWMPNMWPPSEGYDDNDSDEACDDFNKNMASDAFYPGLYMAIDTLEDTLNVIVGDVDDQAANDAARAKAKTAIKAFASYVDSLIDALPTEVSNVEKSLQGEFGPSSLNHVGKAMDPKKTKAKPDALNTGVADAVSPATAAEAQKDPNDEESESNKMAKSIASDNSNGTAGENASAGMSTVSPKKLKAGESFQSDPKVVNGNVDVEKAGKGADGLTLESALNLAADMPLSDAGTGKAPDQGFTRHENDEPNDREQSDDTRKLFVKVDELAKAVAGIGETVAKLAEITKSTVEQLGLVQKSSQEAIVKSDKTALHFDADVDTAYLNMGGRQSKRIVKSESRDDIWGGTALDRLTGIENV